MAIPSFNVQLIFTYTLYSHIYMAQFPLLPLLPLPPRSLCSPCSPCSPCCPAFTYLAPSSCDRNRPPPSQVAYKLTLFNPPITHCPALPGFPEPQLPSA